jgi:hypothetical protein
MCRAANAGTLIPTCEACVAQFPITDNDDNDRGDRNGDRDDVNGSFGFRSPTIIPPFLTNCADVYELLTRCSFSTTTYNPSSFISLATALPTRPGGGPGGPGGVFVTPTGNGPHRTDVPNGGQGGRENGGQGGGQNGGQGDGQRGGQNGGQNGGQGVGQQGQIQGSAAPANKAAVGMGIMGLLVSLL